MSEAASRLCGEAPDFDQAAGLAAWSARAPGVEPPEGPEARCSWRWSAPLEELSATGLQSQVSSRDVARLLAASTPESALLYTGLERARVFLTLR